MAVVGAKLNVRFRPIAVVADLRLGFSDLLLAVVAETHIDDDADNRRQKQGAGNNRAKS